jgi:hypothetical protein
MTRQVSEPDSAATVTSFPLFVMAHSWLAGTDGSELTARLPP